MTFVRKITRERAKKLRLIRREAVARLYFVNGLTLKACAKSAQISRIRALIWIFRVLRSGFFVDESDVNDPALPCSYPILNDGPNLRQYAALLRAHRLG